MKLNLSVLLHGAGLFAAALPSAANIISADFDAPGDFAWQVEYMTDLDQKRDGSPNDGKAYCVPTSAMNLLAYAANFGFPGLLPGPGVWEGLQGYDEMTGYLNLMGVLMHTDPHTGTGGTDEVAGLNAWLDGAGMGAMSVVFFAADEDFWPTIDTAAFFGASGGIVNFAYGRYDITTDPGGLPLLTNRAQGHSVTLQRAIATNGDPAGPRDVSIRNPGSPDDGDLSRNSEYASQHLISSVNMDVGFDMGGDGTFEVFNTTSIVNPVPNDGRLRILDSVLALYPPGGLSYSTIQLNAQFALGGMGFVSGQQPSPWRATLGFNFIDVATHPEQHSAIAIVEGAGGRRALYQLPHRGGNALRLAELPGTSRLIVPGYGHSVYVIAAGEIANFKVRNGQAVHVGSRPIPCPGTPVRIEAAAYNADTDQLLLLSGSGRRLLVLDAATLQLVAVHPLSVSGSTAAAAARSLVVWGTKPARLMAAFDKGLVATTEYPVASVSTPGGSPGVPLALRPLALRGVTDPLSVDVDGGRRLYVSDARQGVLEFTETGTQGWLPATRPWYAGKNLAGRKFTVFKTRTNVRPEVHDTPAWRNIDVDKLIPLGEDVKD